VVQRHETVAHFSSSALAIHSFHCREDNRDFGHEEVARADQIVFVRGGAWEMRLGTETHVLDPNRAVLFRRGDAYRVRHPLRGGDRCTVLTLRDRAARELFGEPGSSSRRVLEVDPRHFLLHHVVLASSRSRLDPLLIEETSLALAFALARRRGTSTPSRAVKRARTDATHRELADRVRCVLGARFRERLLLSEVAESVLWSPYHLARVFRRVAGLPVHRYLTRLRLRFALERLAGDDCGIAAVAAEAGFSSQAHLTDAFRREFGIPPARLRRGIDPATLREMSKILEA